MLIRDGEQFVEVLLVERTPPSRPGAGDLRLRVSVAFGTFRGESDAVWVEPSAFRDFVSELQVLEARRQGAATLTSMDPGELILKVHSTSRAGHMGISGQLGRYLPTGDDGMSWCQLPFSLALPCPSLLPGLVAEFRAWSLVDGA